jgi:peptide/nickel transport system permease protein
MTLQAYIMRRVLIMIPLLLGLSVFVFVLIRLAPGDPTLFYLPPEEAADPAIRLRVMTRLGLDQPLHVQYIRWLSSAVQGDFGFAYGYGEPVLRLIGSHVPATAQLQLTALLLALVFAIAIGIISATRQYSLLDNTATVFAFFGLSMANFWSALLMMFLFALKWSLLPAVGAGMNKPTLKRLKYFIMPSVVLAFNYMATYVRFMRSSMLEVIRQDYITTAHAKGLKESLALFRHALKNAILPLITCWNGATASARRLDYHRECVCLTGDRTAGIRCRAPSGLSDHHGTDDPDGYFCHGRQPGGGHPVFVC